MELPVVPDPLGIQAHFQALNIISTIRATDKKQKIRFTPIVSRKPVKTGWMADLDDVLNVLKKINTMPGGNQHFFVHDILLRNLIATHLHVLVSEDSFKHYGHKYMAVLRVSVARAVNIIITGRQNGKTAVIAKLLTLLLVQGRGISIESFSLTRRQAQNVITRTKEFILRLERNSYYKIGNNNLNEIEMFTSRRDCNKLSCQSANPNSSRGIIPHVSVVDEFGFMDHRFWQRIIVPILGVAKRTLTAITTPGAPASPISEFIRDQLAKAGQCENMYNIINFTMVCDSCKHKDIQPQCRHRMYLIPPWKSFFNLHSILEVLPVESFLVEVMGESTGENNSCFRGIDVLDCFSDAIFKTDRIVPQDGCVYVTIDPTNGADSDMAIMSFIINADGQIVVSM